MAAAWETAGVALAHPLRSGAFRGAIGCPERHGEHVEPLGGNEMGGKSRAFNQSGEWRGSVRTKEARSRQ